MTRLPASRVARLAVAALTVPALAVLTGSSAAAPAAAPASAVAPSPIDAECEEEHAPGWSARVRQGAKQPEPPAYTAEQEEAFKRMPDAPTLSPGSVSVDTVMHVITAEPPDPEERRGLEQQVSDQMEVLNASFSGATARNVDAADTGGTDSPFRFELTGTTWTVNAAWTELAPGKQERKMKQSLHQGGADTLNVYVTTIADGILGFAYFPDEKQPKFLDGIVILDGSLPGGYAGPYAEGDTLVHEAGHWLGLEHTWEGGCSEEGDGVEDTPAQAEPQFQCPEGEDSCAAPGLDPVHNFMNYVYDACMYEFTTGQADRMSDAWLAFRAPKQKDKK